MKPECPDCPFKLWPVVCFSSRTKLSAYCQSFKTDPGLRAVLEAKTLKRPLPITEADPRTAVALATQRKAREIRNCLYASSCGCDGMPRSCSHPDTPLRPYQSDCLTCVVINDAISKQRS